MVVLDKTFFQVKIAQGRFSEDCVTQVSLGSHSFGAPKLKEATTFAGVASFREVSLAKERESLGVEDPCFRLAERDHLGLNEDHKALSFSDL